MISLSPFVRSKAIDIEQDVQKLHIITDPKIHYDLLRLCQHTRLSFFARNVPPDVMMRHEDSLSAVPVLIHSSEMPGNHLCVTLVTRRESVCVYYCRT